jgi:hypothetical protein
MIGKYLPFPMRLFLAVRGGFAMTDPLAEDSDTAIRLYLALFTLGLVLGCVDQAVDQHWTKASICFVLSLPCAVIEFRWKKLKQWRKRRKERTSRVIPYDSTPKEQTSLETPEKKEEMVFVDVTPAYLLNFYKEHIGVQADKLAEAYVGKWMKVSGRLGNVERFLEISWRATFEQSTEEIVLQGGFITMMFYEQKWIDRLAVLRRGDKINVIGQIRMMVASSLVLEKCQLSDIDFKKMAETVYPPPDTFVPMEQAARRAFEAVEHYPKAPRDINPKVVTRYYADLIRISIKSPLYGCAPGSRNKTLVPPDSAEHLYIMQHDDYDASKLWKLSDKKNPAYTEVSIKESDLVKAINAVEDLVKEASK